MEDQQTSFCPAQLLILRTGSVMEQGSRIVISSLGWATGFQCDPVSSPPWNLGLSVENLGPVLRRQIKDKPLPSRCPRDAARKALAWEE